jgi:hypothetical protein
MEEDTVREIEKKYSETKFCLSSPDIFNDRDNIKDIEKIFPHIKEFEEKLTQYVKNSDKSLFCCPICKKDKSFKEGKYEHELYKYIDYFICKTHTKDEIEKFKKEFDTQAEVDKEKFKKMKIYWDKNYKIKDIPNGTLYRATISGRIFVVNDNTNKWLKS